MSGPSEESDDNEEPIEAALAKTILKHCPKITKMILVPQFNHSGLWSGVSLRLLEEFATIEHLHIDGEWGKLPSPIVNLLEIKTTKGWGSNGIDASRPWSLDWGRCGVHVEELLAQSWGCLKLERVSLILIECVHRSPKVEGEAMQRRIAKKVIEFHRQLKMLDNLQVLEMFWYFPYLEQMGMTPEDTWCHPMGRKWLLVRAIPRHEQLLMAVDWTEYPRVEEADVDILNRGYVVTDIGWSGSWRKANVWEEERQEESDEMDQEEAHRDKDENGEYQVYKSRLPHQRESKTKFKKLKD